MMGTNHKNYNPAISSLMAEIQNTAFIPDRHVFTLLKKLEKYSLELKDRDLSAFVYYHYARAYSFRDDYRHLIKYIKKALYFLLRNNDLELLARTYNLFAVEAFKNGSMDIAYEYFSVAKSYVEEDKDSLIAAMIDGNIGSIISDSGDPKRALPYINRCLKIIKRQKKDESYYLNLVLILMNKAMVELLAGENQTAKDLLRQIEKIDADGQWKEWYLILRCRLALIDGDKKEIEALVQQIISQVIQGDAFYELAKDLFGLCQALTQAKEYDLAKQLIDETELYKKQLSPYMASLYIQMKILYFDSIQDEEQLTKCYEERQLYTQQLEMTEKQLSIDSISLMNLMTDLRSDKQAAIQENIELQKKAETDALTGLPNRYALNREIEIAFSEAIKNGSLLGVGMADIDHFKEYNDTYGHHQGDRCLQSVARMLESVSNKYDLFVSRYGGDEFTIIYRGLSEAEIIQIEKELTYCGDVCLSHGHFQAVPDEDSRIWDFLSRADNAMYDSRKQRG